MDSIDQHTTTPPHSPHPLPPLNPNLDSHIVPSPPPQSPPPLPNPVSHTNPLPDPQPLPQPQNEEQTLIEGLGDIQDLGSTVLAKQTARKSIIAPVVPTLQQTVEVLTF